MAVGLATTLAWLVGGSPARAATPLPDGRGYELVTTTASDYGFGLSTAFYGVLTTGLGRSSSSGDSIAFTTGSPPPDSSSGALDQWSIGQRGPGGWTDRSLSPPQEPEQQDLLFGQFPAFSPDLSRAIVTQLNPPLTPEAARDVPGLYRDDTATNAFMLMTGQPQPGSPTDTPVLDIVGSSEDLRVVAYETYAGARQTPDTPTTVANEVYESVDGQLTPVGVLPDGSLAPGGASAETGVPSTVSRDGSHIFFAAAPPDNNPNQVSDLYVRIDGSRTVDVSPSQRQTPDPNGRQPKTFQGASTTGTRALLTSSEKLTGDATTGIDATGTPTQDLYQFDLQTGTLHDLSVDTAPADASTGAAVLGVVGFSPDQSDVYFVATGVLANGATDGAPNLYAASNGTVRLVATLDSSDQAVWKPGDFGRAAEIAPGSGDLLFSSVAPITGYDNRDASTGQPDRELFRYEPTTGQLICVSCNPSGERPSGSSVTVATVDQDRMEIQGRNIDDAGTRIFFESADALVTDDADGAADVYEWEQVGTGTCSSAEDAGGCISLLTPGDADANAHFVESSPDGSNVFISSFEQLVPGDGNSVNDLYDVRVGGGFPATSLLRPPCAASTTCQASTPTPVPPPLAATIAFVGPADPRPARPAARAAVLAHRVSGYRFTIRVRVPRAGRVTVTGPSVVRSRHRFKAGGSATLRLTLTRAARQRLTRQHHLDKVAVKIGYAPATGRGAAHTIHLNFREAKS